MATRLFFYNASNTGAGTYPSGEQSSATPSAGQDIFAILGLQTMGIDAPPGSGTLFNTVTTNTGAVTTQQFACMGAFVSPPLNANQTVGGGTLTFACSDNESNLNANFWVNGLNVYVWRPSTGAKIGTLKDWGGVSMGGLETTSVSTPEVTTFTSTTSAVSALNGDVIVCEVWSVYTQGMATGYTGTFYYGGPTDISASAENAVQSTPASFVQLAETLVFHASQLLEIGRAVSPLYRM